VANTKGHNHERSLSGNRKTDEVEFRNDEVQGPVLVGRGNLFWIIGPDSPHLMMEAVPEPDDEYFIGPDTFED
jgi:hypothetical protein